MLKLLLPVTAKGMNWMYAYDPKARGVDFCSLAPLFAGERVGVRGCLRKFR